MRFPSADFETTQVLLQLFQESYVYDDLTLRSLQNAQHKYINAIKIRKILRFHLTSHDYISHQYCTEEH